MEDEYNLYCQFWEATRCVRVLGPGMELKIKDDLCNLTGHVFYCQARAQKLPVLIIGTESHYFFYSGTVVPTSV